MYLGAAACEVAGIGLVVRQFRKARQRWIDHSDALAQERHLMATDLRYQLDPLVARYGIAPGEVRRATAGLEALMAPDLREQVVTVGLLIAGVVLGTLANLLSLR
jgi:hypothetical protein